MTEQEFRDYWHIGKAQILSGKITEEDFRKNIFGFVMSNELPRLDEEAVHNFLTHYFWPTDTCEEDMKMVDDLAKAICSKFATPKIDVELVEALEGYISKFGDCGDTYTKAKQALSNYKATKTDINLPQRQDSLTDQMNTILGLAIKHGCYDAQDWIQQNFHTLSRREEAPKVRLPKELQVEENQQGYEHIQYYNQALADCRKSLEEQGIKVKK